MIEAYQIGVSLVMNEEKLLGPLAEMLKAFEKVQKAVTDTNESIASMAAGLRGAETAANGLADAMARVSEAAARANMGAGGPRAAGAAPRSFPLLAPPSPGGEGAAPRSFPLLAPPSPGGEGGPQSGGPRADEPFDESSPRTYSNYEPPPAPPGEPPSEGGGGRGGKSGPMRGGHPTALLFRTYMAVAVIDSVFNSMKDALEKFSSFNDQGVKNIVAGMTKAQQAAQEDAAVQWSLRLPNLDLGEINTIAGNTRDIMGLTVPDGTPGSDNPLRDANRAQQSALLTAAALAGSIPREEVAGVLQQLEKGADIPGWNINRETGKMDPELYDRAMDAEYRAFTTARGMAKGADFLNIMKQGALVARMMDPEDFYAMVLASVTEQGGSRTGTGLQSLGRQFYGGKMATPVGEEMKRLGLLGPGGDYKKSGGGITLNEAAQRYLAKKLDVPGGFGEYFDTTVREAEIAHGIKTEQQQSAENYKLLSTAPGQKMGAMFMGNHPQVEKAGVMIHQTLGRQQAINEFRAESINYNMSAAGTAFGNLMEVIEKVNAPAIVATMHAMQAFFEWITGAVVAMSKLTLPKNNVDGNGVIIGPEQSGSLFDKDHLNLPKVLNDTFHPHPLNADPNAPGGNVQKESYVPPAINFEPHVQTISYIQLDGRTIAKAVADQLAGQMALPPTGSNRYSPSTSPHAPSQSVDT